ncbi:hypothetical protein ACRRTK_003332 [Alexandromys fortis]
MASVSSIQKRVEKFFEMKKGQCKDALEIYKRFLTRMTRVSEFLKVAEVSGPDLVAKVVGTSVQHHVWVDKTSSTVSRIYEDERSGAPSPLSKSSPVTTVTSPNSTPAKTIDTSPPVDLFATASAAVPVSAAKPSSDLLDLQPDFSGAAGGAAAPVAPAAAGGATAWGDSLAALSSAPSEAPISDPFAPEPSPPTAATEAASASASATTTVTAVTTEVDLFGDLFDSAPEVAAAPKPDAAPSIDLFGTDAFSSPPRGASPVPESTLTADLLSVDTFAAPSPATTASPAKVESSGVLDLFGGFGGSFMAPSTTPVTPAQNNLLQPNFEAAFGTTPSTSSSSSFDPSVFDGLGDLLMPTMAPSGQPAPVSMVPPSPAMAASKGLGSDLDSSLASLVGNLGISGTTTKKGDLQWNAGEKKLTGGANWQPKVTPATWSAGVPPPPAGTGMTMMPQQPVMFAQPMMRPPFGAAAVPGTQSPYFTLAESDVKEFQKNPKTIPSAFFHSKVKHSPDDVE